MRFRPTKLLLLASLAAPFLMGRATADTFTDTQLRVMTLGDSITEMFRYQPFLRDKFTAAGAQTSFVGSKGSGNDKNEGHSGWSIGQIEDNAIQFITNANANAVLLQIGVNNMNHGLGVSGSQYPPYQGGLAQGAQPGSTLNALGATWGDSTYGSGYLTDRVNGLLDKILDHPNAPFLVVAKIPSIGKGNPLWQSENDQCDSRIKEYNGILQAAVNARQALGKKIIVVDNYTLGNRAYGTGAGFTWGDSSQQSSDWVHPLSGAAIWEGKATNFFNGLRTVVNRTGTNLIVNPSFDNDNAWTQTPSGWSEWEGDVNYNSIAATSSFVESYGGSNSGTRHATHYKNDAYRVYTYQVLTGLTNGLYTLRAYARRTGNQTTCYMEAQNFGSAAKSVNIPASSNYQMIEIKDINVTNGTCTVGFWTVGNTWDSSYFDDVEFFKQ